VGNTREAIESAMEVALASLTPANGYDVPRAIWGVTRKHVYISMVPDAIRPHIVLLTEFESQGPIGFGPDAEKEGVISFAVMVYETVPANQDGATWMNRYTAAIEQCLKDNQFWSFLAEMTEVQGVPTHDLLTVPDAISTVNGRITYLYED
jgi:hypothetical protein